MKCRLISSFAIVVFSFSSAASAAERDIRQDSSSTSQYSIETASVFPPLPEPIPGSTRGPLAPLYERNARKILASGKASTFNVYSDYQAARNHFFPTGFMGDTGDIRMNPNYKADKHSGRTSIRFQYTAKGSSGANWAGVYWLNPSSNWGGIEGRFDLTGARRLSFWARGERGGERLASVKMGGMSGDYPDTAEASVGPIVLETFWQKYEIDLDDFDLSGVSGGFCWSATADENPEGMVFYLDDIAYEFD